MTNTPNTQSPEAHRFSNAIKNLEDKSIAFSANVDAWKTQKAQEITTGWNNMKQGVTEFGSAAVEKIGANKRKIAAVGMIAVFGTGILVGKNIYENRSVPTPTTMELPATDGNQTNPNQLPVLDYDETNSGAGQQAKSERPKDEPGTNPFGDLVKKVEANGNENLVTTDWNATNEYFDTHKSEKDALDKQLTEKFGKDGIDWIKKNVDVVNPVMLDKDETKNNSVDHVYARVHVGETDESIIRDTYGYDRKTGKIVHVDNQQIPAGHDMTFFMNEAIEKLPANHPVRKNLIEVKVRLADGRIVKGYEVGDRWCWNPTDKPEKPAPTTTPTPTPTHRHKHTPTPTPTSTPQPTPTPSYPPKKDGGTVPGPDNTHNIQPTKVPESGTPDNGSQNPVGGVHEVAPTAAPTTAPAETQPQPTEAPSTPQPTPYDANEGNPDPTPGGQQPEVPLGYRYDYTTNTLYLG